MSTGSRFPMRDDDDDDVYGDYNDVESGVAFFIITPRTSKIQAKGS